MGSEKMGRVCKNLKTGPCTCSTHLGSTTETVLVLTGPHQQQVAVLVALIVYRTGQTDLPSLWLDAEKTAGIDEQAVSYWLFLEGHGWSD